MVNRNMTLLIALAVMTIGGIYIVTSISSMNYANILVGTVITIGGFIYLGRGLSRGRGREKSVVALDFIAVALVAVFFLVMLLGALSGLVGNDQPTQNITQFLLLMEFGGLLLTLVSGILVLSPSVNRAKFNSIILYIAANFLSFFILNLIVPPVSYRFLGLSIAPSNPLITVMISIPEETVFHIWLAPWLANVSRTGALGGSFMQAIVATAYHLFVLGTQPAKLGIVFGAFFIAGFTAIKAKFASVTFTSHLVNNFLSVFANI